MDDKKNIVVVGGGGAGLLIARDLSATLDFSKYNLILISSRPFWVILPGTVRMTVSDEGHLEDSVLLPLDEQRFSKGKGKLMVGTVKAIEKESASGGHVVLQNGERVSYGVLILTPGSKWEGPLAFPDDPEEFTAFLKSTREQFANAKSIVLVGGGAVGAEFAGEIKDLWPNKKVTIVQGSNQLLNRSYPSKVRVAVERGLRSRGVEMVFNENIDAIPEYGAAGVTTRSGKHLEADLVVPVRGARPNTEFIRSLGADVLTEEGFVKVNATLQLVGHPEIFAAGDVIDWNEQKQLAKIQNHTTIVAANVISFLGNRPLKSYKGSLELILITNGKNGGLAYFGVLWGIMLGDWFARLMKSKTLMLPQVHAAHGY